MTTTDPTAAQEPGGPVDPIDDPHASKISPNDPRLKLSRPAFSGIKKKPVYALLASTLAAGAIAIPLALHEPTKKPGAAGVAGAEPPRVAENSLVPDAIRDAPETAPALEIRKASFTRGGEASPGGFDRLPVQDDVPPPPTYSPGPGPMVGAVDPARQEAIDEERRAQHASLLIETGEPIAVGGGSSSSPSEDPYSSAANALTAATKAQQAAQAQAIAAARNADDQNLQGRKSDFLSQPSTTAYLTQELTKPHSPYELKAGSLIPSVLVSGINSDLPGIIIGQVRENVYDTTSGRFLLVPQGSRLIAQYDSMVAWGQERVLLCWSRLILPNGNSITLECMPGADQGGYAGLTDKVNEHWWRIVKGAALTSLLSASAVAAVSNTSSDQFANNFVSGAAQQVAQTGAQITERNIHVQPTITVRPGWPLNVMVTKDMILAPYTN